MKLNDEVARWIAANAGELVLEPDTAHADLLTVGSITVKLPRTVSDQGLELTRHFLKNAVEQAMLAKAQAMELAAEVLREQLKTGVELPPAATKSDL